MKSVIQLDFKNKEHRAFFFDVLLEARDTWEHDDSYDAIEFVTLVDRGVQAGVCKAFIGVVNGNMAGVIWVDHDRMRVGTLHGALLPKYQNGFFSKWFVREFLSYCFNTLNLRKVMVELPVFNVKADKLLKNLGFKREGLLKDHFTINGVSKYAVLLGLSKSQFQNKAGVKANV